MVGGSGGNALGGGGGEGGEGVGETKSEKSMGDCIVLSPPFAPSMQTNQTLGQGQFIHEIFVKLSNAAFVASVN